MAAPGRRPSLLCDTDGRPGSLGGINLNEMSVRRHVAITPEEVNDIYCL